MVPDLSIVIPAFNPQERIFSRVLTAIAAACDEEGPTSECVIVDNNSNPPLCDRLSVQAFLRTITRARVVREEAQGLTFARLAGFRASCGRAIVVFDDDNVPAPGYLRQAALCLEQYPFVGVWGPGNVDVELLDAVPRRLQDRVKGHHGRKHLMSVQYGCVPGGWCPFYPIGMGQVIRREVAEGYRAAVESGALSSTDRNGRSLASCGDSQIVWQAINMGYAAGMHPGLQFLHLIPASRSTVKYLRRLMFGCSASYYRALAESFPDEAEAWRWQVPSMGRWGIQISKVVMQSAVRNRFQFLSIDLAELLGERCGHLAVAGRDRNWTFALAKRLGLT